MNFSDRLFNATTGKKTPLCVGFDPHLSLLPVELVEKHLSGKATQTEGYLAAVEEFLFEILQEISDHVGVIKPQFAFFERLGPGGLRLLGDICRTARSKGLIVIGDAKRGDIGSTAGAYASAYMPSSEMADSGISSGIEVDAITLNPFMGFDAIKPFIEGRDDRGVFVLVKTSNPSGTEIQNLDTSSGKVFELVAGMVRKWGEDSIADCGYSNVGAVVGATYPEEAVHLRKLMPRTPFLIPGFGFQGGGPEAAVTGLDSDGLGGVINSSRNILFAYRNEPYCSKYGDEGYAKAAAAAACDATSSLISSLEMK